MEQALAAILCVCVGLLVWALVYLGLDWLIERLRKRRSSEEDRP